MQIATMWSLKALVVWIAVIQGTVKCEVLESTVQNDLEASMPNPAASTSGADKSTGSMSSPASSGDFFSDHSQKTFHSPTSEINTASTDTDFNVFSSLQTSPYRGKKLLSPLISSLTPVTSRPERSTQATHSTPVRGDLPLDLDSEEDVDDGIEYYFLGPTQSMLFGPLPLPLNSTIQHQDLEDEVSTDLDDQQGRDLPESLPATSSERDAVFEAGNLLNVGPDEADIDVPNQENISSLPAAGSEPLAPPAMSLTPLPTTMPPTTTTTTGNVGSVHHDYNGSKDDFNNFVDYAHMVPTTEPPEVITVFTSEPLQLHDKWTWFYLILRGNCHFVDLKHSYNLFYDFVKSLSALLLYNREHIIVDSMTCSGRRMTVNMSIDSMYYPNCEKDLRTLLSHRNLRVNVHNASFYIHSYETKRTLMFETKEELSEKDPYVLYMTLGGVGISLVCIMFAGGLFALYQCCIVKKNRVSQTDISSRYRAESPRSLCPKYEIDQSMSFSDQRTYSVNMYKSYTDLTAPDLYSHLGSPNNVDQEKDRLPNRTKILTKIPKEKTKKKKKKKNNNGIYGLNDCETYQEFWCESITQTNEDYMTVRNLNTMTSSFKTNVMESDKDSMYPLLKKKGPLPVPKKPSKVKDDYFIPPPPSHPPPPVPSTTCPSSPVITKGVLERMDQLINDTYSNSTPDITSNNGYTRSYSNTTINISSASSAVFSGIPTSTTQVMSDSKKKNPTMTSPSGKNPSVVSLKPPSTSSSADNLCLTRITFMEMCVWPQQSNPQLALEGTQSKDHPHTK